MALWRPTLLSADTIYFSKVLEMEKTVRLNEILQHELSKLLQSAENG